MVISAMERVLGQDMKVTFLVEKDKEMRKGLTEWQATLFKDATCMDEINQMCQLGTMDMWQGSVECTWMSGARRVEGSMQREAFQVELQDQTRAALRYVMIARPRLVLLENLADFAEKSALAEAVRDIDGYEWKRVVSAAEEHGWMGARMREWVIGWRGAEDDE